MAPGAIERESIHNRDSLNDDVVNEQLASELRNPSDALHILAQSEKVESVASSTLPEVEHDNLARGPSSATYVDEYELVERGLIHHTTIFELLHMSVNCPEADVARPYG